ncbi:von willebrand factor type A domain protein (macronuclear) [Tetrahymena thermophila SB210]|uniref:von willebrand factor type A domain protein n=1 Tax=Tetrahymena thermophila (strain SB210) TaxID=312017 RepID=I7LWK3_TETTS|nr:von willebrand factor type A domain protein [Tetrahymena thermophila SB210]EAS02049.1 von willebrand factor type A domain protein [Tetrahymena thermophila SB210]|eukprot:XP_001022294.1 von willebrand factor type A domain protein [Tetrahymena thermophila SB210]
MNLQEFKNKYQLFSNHDNLSNALSGISPSGSTHLRDSIRRGIDLIMDMNRDLEKVNEDSERHFLHIIITDGEDTGSRTSIEDLAMIMFALNLCIPSQMIQNHFIGIDFDPNSSDAQQLAALSYLGGDTSSIHLAQTANIDDIFKRIQAQVRVLQQTRVQAIQSNNIAVMRVQQQEQRMLELKIKKFIVVFNLDISGSMAGQRWRQVCNCVSRFTDSLTENDFASVILFNDSIRIVQPITIRIEFQVSSRPSQQQQNNQYTNYNNQNSRPANTQQQNTRAISYQNNNNLLDDHYSENQQLLEKKKRQRDLIDEKQKNLCCCAIF